MKRKITHKAPFDLRNQNSFFGSWPIVKDSVEEYTIAITFPIEGWKDSATIVVTQNMAGNLTAEAHGTAHPEQAIDQALATLSLDVDDSGWEEVGKKDAVIAGLQEKYHYLRPTLFHSPYEAAAGFIIGHRITIPQGRKIHARIAEELGDEITVGSESFCAFPRPEKLLALAGFPGLNDTKIERLHSLAQAVLDGKLERKHLHSLGDEAALAELESLPGIGPFFSQGILYRGAGKRDGITYDDMTYHAIKTAYKLSDDASKQDILAITKKWQPYRMWTIVLLHVWIRESGKFPSKRTFSKR